MGFNENKNLVEPLNLDVIEEVFPPDTVFSPVWYPFPRLEGSIGRTVRFSYEDYIYAADEFQTRIGTQDFVVGEGEISYVPGSGDEGNTVEITIRAIDSETRASSDQVLMIDVSEE